MEKFLKIYIAVKFDATTIRHVYLINNLLACHSFSGGYTLSFNDINTPICLRNKVGQKNIYASYAKFNAQIAILSF